MKNNFIKKNLGFMMVEVLVAVSIMTISVIASMAVAEKALSVSRISLDTAQATFLLEEGAESIRIMRDNAWSNISNLNTNTTYYPTFSGSSWSMSTTPNTVGIFTRTVTISNVNRDATTADISTNGTNDTGTKLVNVVVFWTDGGKTLTKNLSFYVFDIFS